MAGMLSKMLHDNIIQEKAMSVRGVLMSTKPTMWFHQEITFRTARNHQGSLNCNKYSFKKKEKY